MESKTSTENKGDRTMTGREMTKRLASVKLENDQKHSTINQAIESGARIYLDGHLVGSVYNFDVHCPKDNGGFGMTYMIANDYRFDQLYRQAERHLNGAQQSANYGQVA